MATRGLSLMFEVNVTIGLKKGVSDPEGANTLKALRLLGFDKVKEAKTTRTINLLIDGSSAAEVKKSADQMCQRLLTNPIVHTYMIKVREK